MPDLDSDNPNLPAGIGQKPALLELENIKQGGIVRLQIKPAELTRAYTFALHWNFRDIRFSTITPEPTISENEPGILRIVELNPQGLLPIEIVFKANRDCEKLTLFHVSESVAADFSPGDISVHASITPQKPVLYQSFPNPFNSKTTIQYELHRSEKVDLRIFNINGQMVQTLIQDIQPAGFYQVIWNGRDRLGNDVGSGAYLYRLKVGNFHTTRKMVLVK